MRLLCAADLHLGRVPARLPAALAGEARAFGPYAAWETLVATALDERPHALLLAGDVVDDPNDLFEAYGALAHGVARLRAAAVRVVAVAGNHDLAVLPRLAREVDGLELLGEDGTWQRLVVDAGGERAHLIGRSFAPGGDGPVPTGSDLTDRVRAARAEGGAVLGLLHADLDGSDPRYAPVRRAELARFGLDAWLLGHVHAPSPLDRDPLGYLGSLAAFDPGEEGPRGAWRATITPGGTPPVRLEPLPLAPLAYRTVPVQVDPELAPDDLPARVLSALRDVAARVAPDTGADSGADAGTEAATEAATDAGTTAGTPPGPGPASPAPPRAIGVRVLLQGVHRDARALTAAADRDALNGATLEERGRTVFVHELRIEVRPDLDLDAWADRSDPTGALARTVLIARGPSGPERTALIQEARAHLAEAASRPAFADLPDHAPLDDDAVAARIATLALGALHVLIAQRPAPPP